LSKSKNIQIEARLFFELYEYFCKGNDEVDLEYIEAALKTKYERIMAHTYYSMSKRESLTEEQREHFRKEYLDLKGIPEEFRK
jgi:cytidylate kinase